MSIRSYLYAPANRADLLAKVASRGADAMVIDLEDAVPAAEKAAARRAAASFLTESGGRTLLPVFVRVNADAAGLEDIAGLPLDKLTGIRLPKAEDPALVAAADHLLAAAEAGGNRLVLHPLIESVKGLYRLSELVRASTRIERFIFGAGDYVLDVAGEATADRAETLYARSMLVAQSRLLGVAAPIAHVFTPIANLEALARACKTDRAMGFFGRSCIHPSQVAVINESFNFAAAEIARAQGMVDGYLAAVAEGRGSVVVADGTFVDEAGFKRAQRVLAAAAGQRPTGP